VKEDIVRVLIAGPRSRGPRLSVFIALIFLLPLFTPIGSASAELNIQSEDFGIMVELDNVLNERSDRTGDLAVTNAANNALDGVRMEVRESDSADPMARVQESLSNMQLVQTAPGPVVHPVPYDMMLNPENHPDEWANNIWGTLLTADNFVIWTHFKTRTGEEYDHYEEVDFAESALFLGGIIGLLTGSDPLLHEISIDDDSTAEIEVGLTVDTSQSDGWGVEGNPPTTLWVEPTIEFTVKALDPTATIWNHIEFLEVTLMKQFAYSLNPLGQGESYVWVIDSRFTMMPEDFSLEVGLERFWFDIAEASTSFLLAIAGFVTGGADESGVVLSAVAAPYAIHIDNVGQPNCPNWYDPATQYNLPSKDHPCTVGVGFGYIHYGVPQGANDRPIEEIAYLDVGIHPVEGAVVLPQGIDLVLRNDDILTSGFGVTGEGGLDTVEYYADQRADIHLHFHENRANLSAGPGEPFGNITDSRGWLRGMPAGTLSQQNIQRIFRMLGSAGSPELPGQVPERLSLILAIKNFSKDSTPNVDDQSMPVNPNDPPDSLVVIVSTQSVVSVDYSSWFMRSGAPDDHRRLRIQMEDLPTSVVLYGTFQLGGGDDAVSALNNQQSDPLSALLDATILNLVDVFIDIGNIVNSIPEAIVDIVGGDGDGTGTGGELHLELFDTIRGDRVPMALGMAKIELGSSPHPTTNGSHILMARDVDLGLVQGRQGQVEPLVPIAVSVEHSGLKAFHIVDGAGGDQQVTFRATGGDPLRLLYLEHDRNSTEPNSFQSVYISDQPAELDLHISGDDATWTSDRPISEILYAGFNGTQRQVVLIEEFPQNFSMNLGERVSWQGEQPINSITIQSGNASAPRTMDGNHFLFWQDVNSSEASLSARLSGISEIEWSPPILEGADGRDGMPTARLSRVGGSDFSVVLRDDTAWEDPTLGVNGDVLISPLPGELEVAIPTSDGPNQISIPELSTENGLAGVGFFLAGFSELGSSVNQMLGGYATSFTGDGSGTDSFAAGMTLNADEPFSITMDIRQGSMELDEPEWVHGFSMTADEYENRTALHIRSWLPNMPPTASLFVEYTNLSIIEKYHVEIDLEGWLPARSEIIFDIRGFNDQDFQMTLLGFIPGQNTTLHMDADLERIGGQVIPEIMLTSRYEMSHRLDAMHAMLLDREGATRSEVLVTDIPSEIDLNAALGERVHLSMSTPDNEQVHGRSVKSLMMQQQVFDAGKWWPLTVFIRDVPGTMTLDVEPSTDFDITSPTGFQGMPTLDYSSSQDGMDLFISASGRAINSKSDVLLLAEDMTTHASIVTTDTMGISVSSSGEGLGRLYLRQTDMPAMPGIWIRQMEAIGENLKSATIESHYIAGTYPIVAVSDVRGGKIAATARVQVDVGGFSLDARAVFIDAQTTSFIPSASTLGVNGLASDLSLLNAVPGFDSSSTHYLFAEPLSTIVLTLIATAI
jgi:hypothetical protein